MKKSMAIALGALMAMSVASTAMANNDPFKVDGDVRVRYQKITGNNSEMFTRVRVNGEYALDKEFSLYARVAGNFQKGGEHAGSVLDRWGVKYNTKDVSVTAGRQGLFVGQEMLSSMAYYDNERSGKQVDVLKAKFNVAEGTSFTAIGGKMSDPANKDKVYAAQVDHKLQPNFNIGAAYLKVKEFNSYSVYGTYNFTKNFQGYFEALKSNADTKNKAFNVGVGYTIDAKNSVNFNYFGQQANSVTRVANWGGVKAFELFYNYQYSEKLAFQIHDYKVNEGTKDNLFRAQVVYKF